MRVITTQEGAGFLVDETIWRAWVAGEHIRVRLPHAVHSPSLAWEDCMKVMEINMMNPPRWKSMGEWSTQRRFKCIEKDQNFTKNLDDVDCSKKIFRSIPDCEEFMESGEAVW